MSGLAGLPSATQLLAALSDRGALRTLGYGVSAFGVKDL